MLTITLLGTAATMPLPERALTAAVAECGGHSLLLDCGEGTQTAARRAGVNLMRADAICLTHYHGDHIFGLPGLLQTLGAQGRTRPLVLLGPEGLLEVWRAVYALTGPLPYAVKPLVCRAGQPVALDALSDGWPAGAALLPVATKHRVRSLGYRLELPRALYDAGFLFPLGLHPLIFASADYYPLLPWIFLFLAGYWLGEAFLQRRVPEFCYREHLPALGWIGRHALIIYLVHQPVVYGVLWIADWLL